MECLSCKILQDVESCEGRCAIVEYDGKKSFLKVLGEASHGPSNPVEVSLPATVFHENILSIVSIKRWKTEKGPDHIGIIYEIASDSLINWATDKNADLNKRFEYAYQAVCGICAIHQAGYLHLDIKPDNFVLVDGKVKVIDFGHSRKSIDEKLRVKVESSRRGEPYVTGMYRAPELWGLKYDALTYTDKVDIYALGVSILIILTGRAFYPRTVNVTDHSSLEKFITSDLKNRKYIEEIILASLQHQKITDSKIFNLVMSMIDLDPRNRPSIIKVLNHEAWSTWNFPKPESVLIKTKPPIRAPAFVLESEVISDVSFIVEYHRKAIPEVPCSTMFLAVDLYYRTLETIGLETQVQLLGQRKYTAAACCWIALSVCYSNSEYYYDKMKKYFPISNAEVLDLVINKLIVRLEGVIQPNSFFDMASDSEQLRYIARELFYKPSLYLKFKNDLPTFRNPKYNNKFISIRELDY
jgi:hypothetical protein